MNVIQTLGFFVVFLGVAAFTLLHPPDRISGPRRFVLRVLNMALLINAVFAYALALKQPWVGLVVAAPVPLLALAIRRVWRRNRPRAEAWSPVRALLDEGERTLEGETDPLERARLRRALDGLKDDSRLK